MKTKTGLIFFCLTLVLTGCNSVKRIRAVSSEFNYLQSGLDSLGEVKFRPLTIQPNDILSISVTSSSLNQEQVAIFALTNTGGMGQQGGMNVGQQMGPAIFGYLVDEEGNITFPLLGKIKAAGFTRAGLAQHITEQLTSRELVKEPSVLIRFTNLRINVLGEVKMPGIKNFTSDRITLMEALAAAGDLTDRGVRSDILIMRQEQGKVIPIHVNLNRGSFVDGPGYQLQQNDIIYVRANDLKLREVNFNPRFSRDLQITTSVASLAVILFNILFVLGQ